MAKIFINVLDLPSGGRFYNNIHDIELSEPTKERIKESAQKYFWSSAPCQNFSGTRNETIDIDHEVVE